VSGRLRSALILGSGARVNMHMRRSWVLDTGRG
jgi:hypothetical protein